jgi:hypothetical protein
MYISYELKRVYPIFKVIFNRETNHLLKKKEMKWFVLHRCNLKYISTTSFYPSSVPLQREKTHLLSSLPIKWETTHLLKSCHLSIKRETTHLSSLPLKRETTHLLSWQFSLRSGCRHKSISAIRLNLLLNVGIPSIVFSTSLTRRVTSTSSITKTKTHEHV